MQLSKRTQYGIRAMICLCAAYPRGYIQTRELATREGLPTKFLESILSTLTRGKILVSKIGAMGGYRLARHPRDILIGEVIARLEGGKVIQEQTVTPHDDLKPGELAVEILQLQLSDALRRVLENTSLSVLADQTAQRSRGGQMYFI